MKPLPNGGLCLRALLLILILLTPACSRQAPEHRLVQAVQGKIRIPLADVDDGNVCFFTYKFKGKNINFFIRTDGTGRLQAHFDACYSCFKYKLGYVREENRVVCIACRIGFDLSETVWDYIGACAPISLKSGIEGDELVIEARWLEAGLRYF